MTVSIVSIALIFISIAIVVFLFYLMRKERLHEREAIVNQKLSTGAYDDLMKSTGDGFIFCTIWRLSHIRTRAKSLGVQLEPIECYSIVNAIKHGFNPDEGINYYVIDKAIREYISKNTPHGWEE